MGRTYNETPDSVVIKSAICDVSSNDDHSNENDEVNGDDDQVKTEELFDSIAIFLFFPLYKYRKKRWPGKLDQ